MGARGSNGVFAARMCSRGAHHNCAIHVPLLLVKIKPFAMAISKDLLEILVCPVCRAELEMKPDESGLKCVECHRVYPIRDDIPVMLIDEAKIEE
jgi:uncharacterized protein